MTHALYDDNYYVYNYRYDTLAHVFYCSNMKHDNVQVERLHDDHARLSYRGIDSSLLITHLIILITRTS